MNSPKSYRTKTSPSLHRVSRTFPNHRALFLFFFFPFVISSHHAAKTHLEFIPLPSVTSNLQQSSCLSFSRLGVIDMCHHTWLPIRLLDDIIYYMHWSQVVIQLYLAHRAKEVISLMIKMIDNCLSQKQNCERLNI